MNLRSLCFSRIARDNSAPWLWWDFVDGLGDACAMRGRRYTAECAEGVFTNVTRGLEWAAKGLDSWRECWTVANPESSDPLPLLDAELLAQTGNGSASTVAILPTIRVNAKQYRGSLDAGSVTRALCAAFPAGQEPAVCNERWVSEDECAEGGEGWLSCSSG